MIKLLTIALVIFNPSVKDGIKKGDKVLIIDLGLEGCIGTVVAIDQSNPNWFEVKMTNCDIDEPRNAAFFHRAILNEVK